MSEEFTHPGFKAALPNLKKARTQFFNRAEAHLKSTRTKRISDSKGAFGVDLEPVQKWTRKVTGHSTRKRVLNRTGDFKRSHRRVSKDENTLVWGATGWYARVAHKIIAGGESYMAVDTDFVRTRPNGTKYIRIRANDERWFSKEVIGDSVVKLNLPSRDYMSLDNDDIKFFEDTLEGLL